MRNILISILLVATTALFGQTRLSGGSGYVADGKLMKGSKYISNPSEPEPDPGDSIVWETIIAKDFEDDLAYGVLTSAEAQLIWDHPSTPRNNSGFTSPWPNSIVEVDPVSNGTGGSSSTIAWRTFCAAGEYSTNNGLTLHLSVFDWVGTDSVFGAIKLEFNSMWTPDPDFSWTGKVPGLSGVFENHSSEYCIDNDENTMLGSTWNSSTNFKGGNSSYTTLSSYLWYPSRVPSEQPPTSNSTCAALDPSAPYLQFGYDQKMKDPNNPSNTYYPTVWSTDSTWYNNILLIVPNTVTEGVPNFDGALYYFFNEYCTIALTDIVLRTHAHEPLSELKVQWFYGGSGDDKYAPSKDMWYMTDDWNLEHESNYYHGRSREFFDYEVGDYYDSSVWPKE